MIFSFLSPMLKQMKKNCSKLIASSILLFIFISTPTLLTTCNTGKNANPTKRKHIKKVMSMPTLNQQEIENQENFIKNFKEYYNQFFNRAKKGPIIPGIFQQAVPQGLFYLAEKDWFLISNYMNNGYPSNITIINASSGKHIKTLWLKDSTGNPFYGHVGGIAANKTRVWIASGNGVYEIPINKIESSPNNSYINFDRYYQTETRASFASYSDDVLWIGEFARYTKTGRNYRTKEYHHLKSKDGSTHYGWVTGYKTDPKKGNIIHPDTPDFILSIPEKVQGITFIKNKIVLSTSYGRRNDSYIYIYSNPMMNKKPDMQIKLNNRGKIPLWFLDNTNKISQILSPPMTEGITLYHSFIAVLFESGSDKYRPTSSFPLDSIYLINIF